MSHRGRQSADEALAAELAAGRSVRDAAVAVGLSEKTVHRRNADPAFRDRVAAIRARFVADAVGRLSASMTAAADALSDLLASPDPNLRLRAAVEVLRSAVRVREHDDLTQRIARLEQLLADRQRGERP